MVPADEKEIPCLWYCGTGGNHRIQCLFDSERSETVRFLLLSNDWVCQ